MKKGNSEDVIPSLEPLQRHLPFFVEKKKGALHHHDHDWTANHELACYEPILYLVCNRLMKLKNLTMKNVTLEEKEIDFHV